MWNIKIPEKTKTYKTIQVWNRFQTTGLVLWEGKKKEIVGNEGEWGILLIIEGGIKGDYKKQLEQL